MKGLLKIAFRSVLADRRRSLLIGLSLFVSCTLLLLADAIGNGAGTRLLGRHHAVSSGDVAVIWKNVLEEVDPSDPGRLSFSQFDAKTDARNRAAISRFDEFLFLHAAELDAVFMPVRGFGMLDTGELAAYSMIYGASTEELAHLKSAKAFELVDGEPLFNSRYGAYVSRETAEKNGIWVGDYVSLDATTASGLVNTMDFQVAGVYRNGAPWDNITVYVQMDDARELMEWGPEYFSSARIYLRHPEKRGDFAAELDAFLTASDNVLRAEASDVSSRFWSSYADFFKALLAFFVVFLLLVIAVGIRSTIRMNLFQRIQEFGTLRAIGFSRSQGFLIIFSEVFLVSVMALAAACAFTVVIIAFFARTGIYIGPGPASYVLGGELVYPVLNAGDLSSALGIVTAFSLLSPLGPGLKLCGQKITDMLAKRQRRVSEIALILKGGSQ
jgi:ABC-type lipoprotein release transport system permease subunit